MNTPFLIHDAQVALFPAWEDGMPMTGPSPLRTAVAPFFQCLTSIRWSRNAVRKDSAFGDHRRAGDFRAEEIAISIAHPEGVVLDPVGHAHRLPSMAGRYCLVVVLWAQEANQWQRWQFFHVRIANDSFDGGDGSDASARPLELIAEHIEFDTYTSSQPPACVPEVLGRVDFICGPLHIPCMTYDMLAEEWRMTTFSDTGITHTVAGEETSLAYCLWDEPEITDPVTLPGGVETSTFSLMQPRTEIPAGMSPPVYLGVVWQQRLFFSLQRSSVTNEKNVLLLHHAITLEANGSPEPIERIEQDQMLHESVAVFRVLDRVYATVGHDCIAVPAIHYGEVPLSTNYFFKLGDTILDDQGWWNLAEPVVFVSGPSYP
jgi:hypothetical protein